MRANFCQLVAFAVLATAVAPLVAGIEAAPKYTVDLAASPEHRWTEAVKLVTQLHGWDNSFGPGMKLVEMVHLILPPSAFTSMEAVVRERFSDQHKELQGIAKALGEVGYPQYANVTFLIALPFMYELQHINTSTSIGRKLEAVMPRRFRRACTGILSLPEDPKASMIHGRNLDESPATMRNLTLDITVVRNGTYLYSVFDYTWITTGFYTASRVSSDGLTLEENWRDYNDPSFEELMGRIENSANFVPVAFLFRSVMDAALSFDAAVHFLTVNATLASPAYIIMSGSGRRGAVLTLFMSKEHNVREYLTDNSSVTYMVQTNYDRWLPDPPGDPRRTVAESTLAMLSPHRRGSPWGVWIALSTFPVHNKGTLFSAVMRSDAATEGFVRRAMVPANGKE